MQTKTIICPVCKTTLEVRNSKNEKVKIIKCPECVSQLRVRFEIEEPRDGEPDTIYDPQDTDKTELPDQQKEKKAFLVCDGKRYELSEGENIVGRMGTSSKADVQIKTTDKYMSRHNAIISVGKTSKGLVVSIAKHKDVPNPIIVRKEELLDGDEIVIHDGDPITMGKTIVTLVLE